MANTYVSFVEGIAATDRVLAHGPKDCWPVLNSYTRCYNSTPQILFYSCKSLVNEILEVAQKQSFSNFLVPRTV